MAITMGNNRDVITMPTDASLAYANPACTNAGDT